LTLIVEEALLFAVVPRLGAFRRYVDRRIEEAEREAAAEARLELLAQMTSEHRSELERLEAVADKIRERITPAGSGVDVVVNDCLGLGQLLSTYVKLAIAYKASMECLAATNRQALRDEIRVLSAARLGAHEQARALALRRLAIAEMRAERWDRSWSDVEAMRHQLAMIGELIHLTHEQCSAPADPRAVSAEIDRAIASLQENEHTLRELGELLAEQRTVEARMLHMGRPVPSDATDDDGRRIATCAVRVETDAEPPDAESAFQRALRSA
jgi:hypothetical protein